MYAVEMHGITKQFKNVLANSNVELMVKRGEIHSLLGENGAGKSTLMNILYGMYAPTSGQIIVQGQPVVIENPLKAISLGIAMVHQHFMLIEPLTVAENVVLGYEPKKRGCFDMKKAVEEVNTLADQYGLHVDAHEKVENLSVGTKQRVEILKALYRKADILILDEPTAVLTPQEVSDLFRVLRKLKESGKTIIIITHKLKETLELADTVTVLRKGQVISSLPVTKEMDQAQLAELMVGRIVSLETEKKPVPGEHEVVMALQNATLTRDKRNLLDDVNLEIRSGEILGIAGVEGNGQTELIDVLTGLQRLTSGHVVLGGKQLPAHRITPRFMLEARVGHIPEDRGKRGFVPGFTIAENIVLGYHRNKPFAKHGIINRKARDEFANRVAKQYDVRMDSINDTVGSLSGGNQQKVIIGRVFAQNPQVIIAAQPTRGVDIGAIEYIHSELVKMRDAGKAVLLISADLDELMRLSDKIAVLYDGRIVDRRDASEYDERTLGALMTGHTPESMEKEAKQA